MNRRQFTKRAALTLAAAGISGSAFKCSGGEKVSIYVQTISTFLNEIAGILPDKAAFISKIVKVASDFDAAFRGGDFANADSLLNTLITNITTLTNDIGISTSNQVKMWLSVIGATVRTVAVLFKEANKSDPTALAKSGVSTDSLKSASAIERLASQAAVDAAFQATKLK